MPRKFLGIASVCYYLTLAALLLLSQLSPSIAGTFCDPQTTYLVDIGYEFLAADCIPEGMTDTTPLNRYIATYVTCSNSVVSYSNAEGDWSNISPADLTNLFKNAGYRVFRNKEGSHVVVLQSSYTGLIGGKAYENDMGNYTGGNIYTDIFKEAFVPQISAPNCQGDEFNRSSVSQPPVSQPTVCQTPVEINSGSTVNLGTGRLSHNQQIFSVNSGMPLALEVSLNYRSSIPTAPSTIGNGWSHSYEMSLQNGAQNSKVFWYQGTRRIYINYKNAYYAPRGDFSTLVLNGNGTWTITEPDGLKRNFDSSGVITSLSDRYGNILTFNYSNTKLSNVTDPSARSVSFGYDPSGKLITITDPNNKGYTLNYPPPSGKLDTLTLPGGDYWRYTYNASNGLLESKTDPGQFTTTYVYPGQKVTTATDPNQKPRLFAYSSDTVLSGKIPDAYTFSTLPEKSFTLTDKNNNEWLFKYDNLIENIRSKTDPLGNTISYTYYPNGLTKSVTNPPLNGISYTTFYTYDAMGNVTGETEPLNLVGDFDKLDPSTVGDPATDIHIMNKLVFSYAYDLTNLNPAFKNLITRIDDKRGPNTLTTTYSYTTDANGHLVTTVTDPTKATTVTRYYSNGKIKDITDANQSGANPKQTIYSYYEDTQQNRDSKIVGFLKTIVTPDGVTTSYFDPNGVNVAYDANGNNIWYAIIDKDGVLRKTVVSTYDDRNRLHTVTTQASGQPDIVSTYGYDPNDNVNSVKDAEQKETKYLFDFNSQTNKITDARLKDTNLIYNGTNCSSCSNGADKLTSVKDANQHSTNYSYDKAGRLEYETDPVGKKYHYTYHPNGKLDKKYNATSGTDILQVTYSYNSRGQITGKIYADGSTPNAAYGYDSNGRLQTASNSNISYTFGNYTGGSYKGRLKSVKDNTHNRTVSYDQYDKLGLRQQVTYSGPTGSRSISYQYDDANRPWIITAAGKVFTYLYDKLGRRDTISYPNGITVKHDYDNLDRLKALTHSTASSKVTYANYSGFDKTGSRLNKITSNGTESYHYDDTYRLTQTDSLKGSEKYTYDDVGNRMEGPGPKESLPLVTYAYDDANRMTHGRQLGYTYDDAGNQITRTIPNAPDKGWTLTWDMENRLTQVYIFRKVNNIVVESRTIDFKYDPFDRRLEKKVSTFIDNVSKVVGTWQFLYDGINIAAEYFTDSGGTTTTYYVHGPGMDEHLAMERGGTYYYFHADGLGSITAITDGTATPVQTYSYDSFGVPKQTKPFRNSFMYAGKAYDLETGLTEMGARYYDPREGQFVQKDPISYYGGINMFSYVQNNPIGWTDPTGLYIGQYPPAPPGYNPSSWTPSMFDDGTSFLRDPNGNKWLPHPEDRTHWRHWDKQGPDGKDDGRWPPDSKKPWQNQKKPKKDQCPTDPSGDAPEFQFPMAFMPIDPVIPSVKIPMRFPVKIPIRILIPAW